MSTTSINKKLNIVLPIQRGTKTIEIEVEVDGKPEKQSQEVPNIIGYVYAIPLSTGAFEMNFDLLGRTFTRITTGGFGAVAGPRGAAIIMRKIDKDAAQPLLDEMMRSTMFASLSSNKGWVQMPLTEAIQRKFIDEDESSEVENALAFFIVASSMYKKSENREAMLGLASLWGALPISSNFTEFLGSLQTSTEAALSTEKKAVELLVPR